MCSIILYFSVSTRKKIFFFSVSFECLLLQKTPQFFRLWEVSSIYPPACYFPFLARSHFIQSSFECKQALIYRVFIWGCSPNWTWPSLGLSSILVPPKVWVELIPRAKCRSFHSRAEDTFISVRFNIWPARGVKEGICIVIYYYEKWCWHSNVCCP